ncbi:unnamed protein product [Durusdinium trenchii]|uniref:Myotubularin phosphatase domain-containing protein n=1 Tax=Durusdinium trenchii TaxID=1381693 RepID=A0ABP0KIC5_9DINO
MNELLYNPRAVEEMRQVHAVRDTLWKLQATSNTGLGDASDEQIRMFATEVEKKCFGAAGDPFAPMDNLKTGLAAAQEAKELLKSQGSRLEIPKLPVKPLSERPNEDIRFDDILPGEKVHYSISPSVLPINKPFRELQGRLLISNYRLKFQVPKGTLKDKLAWVAEKQLLDVPLGLVEKLEYEGVTSEAGVQQWRLTITTKDFRNLMIMVPQMKDLVVIEEAVLALSQPGASFVKALFAFAYVSWLTLEMEFCCGDYQLCDTYPAVLVLPAETSHEHLRRAAAFRKHGRIPTLSWCNSGWASLWRCSQPMEGLLGQLETSDEKMLKSIRCGKDRDLLVLDLRPKKAAYANKVNGGGFESYAGLRLVFGNIDNVHGVRLLPVAMLCMDPHYRTLRGLLLLIQKEFCSFGHRFRTRLANGEKPSSE